MLLFIVLSAVQANNFMTYFPATSSTLSAAHLGAFLKDSYNLSDDTSCSLIKAGVNHTYMVSGNSGKYVFRVYSQGWRTEQAIAEEIRLLQHLKNGGIPVSYALADAQGNYLQQFNAIEGSRQGVLFSYAEGEKVIHFSGDMHYRIGEIMARLHALTLNFKLNRATYTPELVLVQSLGQLQQYISPDTDEFKFMAATQGHLLAELRNANTAELRTGAVHLDIWFDNLNVNTDNEITIFDFDFCGNGWLCYDVAYYIMQLYTITADTKEYADKINRFLDGYEQTCKLSSEEKRLLPLLGTALYFFYLGVQCERFENWSNVFVSETYLKRFIEARVKKYYDFREELKAMLDKRG